MTKKKANKWLMGIFLVGILLLGFFVVRAVIKTSDCGAYGETIGLGTQSSDGKCCEGLVQTAPDGWVGGAWCYPAGCDLMKSPNDGNYECGCEDAMDCPEGTYCAIPYCPPDAYCWVHPTCHKLETGRVYTIVGMPTGSCPIGTYEGMMGNNMYCKATGE